jgi:hypothetical protein
MEPYLEFDYEKICRKRKRTPIAYKDKLGKNNLKFFRP